MQTSDRATRKHLWGLVRTLVRTDFKTRYHGSLSGFVWALLRPLAMFVVLMAIFSLIFHSEPDYALDLVIGLFLWDFFAESTKTGLGALHAKGFLLTKARFPSWILVVTSGTNAIITVSAFVVVLCAYLAFVRHSLDPAALLLFGLYLVCFQVIVVGISLATSVLFLRYRDLNQVWDLVLQVGFFVAPIIYPLGVLPEVVHAPLFLWPPTPIIDFSRQVLVAGTWPTAKAHLLLFACSAIILAAGALIFRRLAPRAAEYLG